MPEVKLNTGATMPMLGLGTWKMDDEGAARAVHDALRLGYRLIDTAAMYGNERGVGRAVRESSIPREEIFVTTKLWPTDFFEPQRAFDASMERLGLDYVDLYLVHWPIPMMPKGVWPAMEKILASERARAIGVSNYGVDDMERLLEYAGVVPAVNQIQLNPFRFEGEVLAYCRSRNIIIEAYSPLALGARLNDATMAAIAKKYGKTTAQLMLRWCIEHEAVPIPKTTRPERMKENLEVFDFSLSREDMQTLDSLR